MSIKYNVSGIKSIGRSAEQRLSNDYVVYGYPYYENGVCTEFATDSDHMYFVKKDKNTIYVDIRDINDIKAYIYDVPNDRFVTIKGAIFDQDVTLLQSDWNEDDETDILHILNKPTTLSAFQNDVGYITNSTAEIGWTNLNQELQSIISGASELFFILDNASYLIVNQAVSLSNYPILRHNGKFYFYSHKGSNNEYYFYSIDGDGRCIDTFNTWSDVQLLSNVAYSGDYADLNNKPNLNVYAVKGSIVWNDLSQELRSYLDSNSLQYVTTNNSFSVINGYVQSDKYPILKHDGKLYFYSYKDSNNGIYFYNTHGEGKYVDITGTWHDTQLLSTVAKTGNYSDLIGKPTIKQADWSVTNSSDAAYIKHKPSFKTINFESIIGSGNISTIPKLVITSSGLIEIDGTTYQDHLLWLNYLADETGKTHFEFTQLEMANLGFTSQVIGSIINESVLRIEQNWEVDQEPGSPYYKTFEVIDTQMLLNQQNEEDYTVWFSLRADNDRVWKFRGDYDAGEGVATWTLDYEEPLRLADVAVSGNYNDLVNKPDLSVYDEVDLIKNKQQVGFNLILSSIETNDKIPIIYDPDTKKLYYYSHRGTENNMYALTAYFFYTPDGKDFLSINQNNQWSSGSGIDLLPTQNSTNLVTSGGVYAALGEVKSKLHEIDLHSNRVFSAEIRLQQNLLTPILITDIPANTNSVGHDGCVLLLIRGFINMYENNQYIRKPIDMLFSLCGDGSIIKSGMVSRGGWIFPKIEFFTITQNGQSHIGAMVSNLLTNMSYCYLTFDIIDDLQEDHELWTLDTTSSINSYIHGGLDESELIVLDTIVKRAVADQDGNVIKDTYVKIVDLEDTPFRSIIREVTPIN